MIPNIYMESVVTVTCQDFLDSSALFCPNNITYK